MSVMRSTKIVSVAILLLSGAAVWAQVPPPPPPSEPVAQPAQILSPDQLDNLVAPVALYPDPVLGQVLAAATYPLELVEAQQWLQQNPNLRGMQLIDAAKQQNWDPSVQAMVSFPDVLSLLTRDIQWTTALGNAYLAQQNDIMAAIQRMRARAEANGRLTSTPQQTVTTQTQNGQSAIVIEPAQPNVIYVPAYNPEYIWGPPVYGYYPPLWYPSIGFGFGFGPGIFLSSYYPGWGGWGWGGWGPGWGWGLGWFGGGIYVNNVFFTHYGYHGYYGGGYYRGFAGGGRYGWQHDPFHRAGVGYANAGVAARYSNNARFAEGRAAMASRGFNAGAMSGARGFAAGAAGARGFSQGASRGGFNGAGGFNGGSAARGFAPSNGLGNAQRGFSGQGSSGQGFSGQGFGRSYAAPQSRGYAAPQSQGFSGQSYRGYSGSNFGSASRSFEAPRSYGGFSGGQSFGRSSGGSAFGGGGRSFSSGGGSFGGGGGRSFGGGGGHSFGGGGGHSFGGGGGHGRR